MRFVDAKSTAVVTVVINPVVEMRFGQVILTVSFVRQYHMLHTSKQAVVVVVVVANKK